jgi:rhodanese-related sulfurtransferase
MEDVAHEEGERSDDREGVDPEGDESRRNDREDAKLDSDEVDTAAARRLIATSVIRVIDLRDEEEFAGGHIAGAARCDADDLDSALNEVPDDAPLIVVCANGERSSQVAEELRERGRDAAHISGGMDAWSGDGLPLQPAVDYEYEGPRRPGPLGQ